MMKTVKPAWALAFLALGAICLTSCVTAQGQVEKGKIPAKIEIKAETNNQTNRLNTQHVFIARVTDAQGRPVPEARVEWILQRHMCQVGDIVDVGALCSPCLVSKLTNTYALGETARRAHTLPDGTFIDVGEAWLVVTSSFPGDTNVIAYAPGIENWQNHKAFGVKHWGPDYDYGCDTTPGCAPGGGGRATVWVQKDGGSATNYRVDFVGEGVTLSPNSCTIGPFTPNSMERNSCSVDVSAQAPGSYRISYTITPTGGEGLDDNCCCPGAMEPVHEGGCTVDFGAGELVCSVSPLAAQLCPGDPASFEVTVTNVGTCPVSGAQLDAAFSGCGNCQPVSTAIPTLAAGSSWSTTVACQSTQNCNAGTTLAVQATVSAAGVNSTMCNAQIGFGNPSVTCSLRARATALCPGDGADFDLVLTNSGSCDSAPVTPTITVMHNGSPIGITPTSDCTWPAVVPAGGTYQCSLSIAGNQLPASGSVCVNVQVDGSGANCNACVELGTISVVCDKRLTNGDAQGRLEVGDTANFAVNITNTSSCGVTLTSFSDNSTCGAVNDSQCQALVGQLIPARGTVSCNVTVDTSSCAPGEFENVVNVGVNAGSAQATTECRARFATFVIPAMECSFVDIIDPVYTNGTPDDANRSSTTVLEWTYVNQRFVVDGVVFRWEIPQELALRNGASAASVDVSGAPHFSANDLRFSNIARGGTNYTVIEIQSAQPIPQEGQGTIQVHVNAAQAGLATTKGYWRFRGYEEWVQEDCGTTVR